MDSIRFHLAFPVNDIPQTKVFYADGLGCEIGRESPVSVILNLQGHQLVAHLTHDLLSPQQGIYPRHFGLIFPTLAGWEDLRARAEQRHLPFYQSPQWRFRESPLEHATFFLEDPFHNLLEFKYYRHAAAIFGEQQFDQVGDVAEVSR